MKPGPWSLTSVLLIVLLGASPLVGPVCALLCGHTARAASGMHGAQDDAGHEHASHQHADHEHAAHAGQHTEPHVASAPGRGHSPRMAVSSGESCCAFGMASSAAASAPRIQALPTVLETDGVVAARIPVHGSGSHSIPSIPIQPRPDSSSGRAPLALRI